MRIPVVIVAAALAGGGGCGSGCSTDPAFPDDSCEDPAAFTADSVEIGSGEDAQFAPLPEGEIRPIVYGTQGGSMVTVTLRLRGDDVPGCIAQSTSLIPVSGGELRGIEDYPKRTYLQDDGSYTTRYIFVQFWDLQIGDSVQVHSEAAGQTDEVLIYLDEIGMPDAGVDAMIDGGPDAT